MQKTKGRGGGESRIRNEEKTIWYQLDELYIYADASEEWVYSTFEKEYVF